MFQKVKNASYISTKKEEIAPIYNKLNRNSQKYAMKTSLSNGQLL